MIVAALLTLTAQASWAQGDVYERSKVYEWPQDQQVVNKLKQWQDLKFGVLMHWGVYSVPGMVESWAICDEDWGDARHHHDLSGIQGLVLGTRRPVQPHRL